MITKKELIDILLASDLPDDARIQMRTYTVSGKRETLVGMGHFVKSVSIGENVVILNDGFNRNELE